MSNAPAKRERSYLTSFQGAEGCNTGGNFLGNSHKAFH
jgi:hypothetical protein